MVSLPGNPVIEGFHNTRDGALVRTIEGGQMGLWRVAAKGEPQRVALPFAGSVMVMSTIAGTNEAFVGLGGWTQPSAVYRLGAKGQIEPTGMSSQPAGYTAMLDARAVTASPGVVLSVSPELFFDWSGDTLTTRPMWASLLFSISVAVLRHPWRSPT